MRGGSRVKNGKNPEKRSGTVWLAYYAATSRICAGGSSKPNGSGYPLSVPAVVLGGGKGEVKPPVSNTPPRVGGSIGDIEDTRRRAKEEKWVLNEKGFWVGGVIPNTFW